MKIIRTAKLFQKTLERERRRGRSIGFVPTMGALHAGHLALVQAARKNQIVAVSIFVNPTQFGPAEDFTKYPRVLTQDAQLLKKAGVDYLFYPSVEEMYPSSDALSIRFHPQATYVKGLCARYRPGHFEGVATVVAKLFNLSGSCRAYFGAKDYQQTIVIKHLIKDMLFPVQIIVCPTLREKDGLAMSSRNRYLSVQERRQAAWIYQLLTGLKRSIENFPLKQINLALLRKQAVASIERQGIRVQYLEIVDAEALTPVEGAPFPRRVVAAMAGYVGKTRLIDNVIIPVSQRRKSRKKGKRV